MITNGTAGAMTGTLIRRIVLAIALGLILIGPLSHAQTQRKPKGPKPPSYEEVMQRALNEKKAVSNAPTIAAVAPRVEPSKSVQQSNSNTPVPVGDQRPPVLSPATEVQSLNPAPTGVPAVVIQTVVTPKPEEATAAQPTGTAPPPVSPVLPQPFTTAPLSRFEPSAAVVPKTSATARDNPNAKPPAKNNGPVFSPLPPDLAPANEVPRTAPLPVKTVAASGSTNVMETLDDKHLLAIGDRLSFRIVEDEEKSPTELVVTDSGELEVPYIGRIAARDRSCKELARTLKVELEKEYYVQATVILGVDLMARSRGKVYLVGAIRVPGPLEIPSDESLTVSKAILRAGGFTDFADKKHVKVTRKMGDGSPDQTFIINVEVILEKGKSEADLPLLPGDLIYVPERLIRF